MYLVIERCILYARCWHESLIVRTTLNIDDEILSEARRVTGLVEKTALVKAGWLAIIERESARRLARLGGTDPQIHSISRRRSEPK